MNKDQVRAFVRSVAESSGHEITEYPHDEGLLFQPQHNNTGVEYFVIDQFHLNLLRTKREKSIKSVIFRIFERKGPEFDASEYLQNKIYMIEAVSAT